MCNICDVCKAWVYKNYPWVCMKCFLEHDYVFEMLLEAYDMIACLWDAKSIIMLNDEYYVYENACQTMKWCMPHRNEKVWNENELMH